MGDYTYEKVTDPETGEVSFNISKTETTNHTITTTIEQEQAIVDELKAKVDLHEEYINQMKKL